MSESPTSPSKDALPDRTSFYEALGFWRLEPTLGGSAVKPPPVLVFLGVREIERALLRPR